MFTFYSNSAFDNGINQNNHYFTAGVDCCGFVYRASEYANAPYEWSGQIADDSAERYAQDERSPMGEFHERERYPVNFSPYEEQHHNVIVSREGINDGDDDDQNVISYFTTNYGINGNGNSPTAEDFERFRALFLMISPGDIIFYGTSHIGMIDSIDRQAIMDATNIADMMRAITTIESVYGSYISFVIKRSMMDGIDLRGFNNENGAIGSWHNGWLGPLNNWKIVRLEVVG